MKPKFTLSNTSWGQSPGQLLGTEEEEPSKKTGEKKKKLNENNPKIPGLCRSWLNTWTFPFVWSQGRNFSLITEQEALFCPNSPWHLLEHKILNQVLVRRNRQQLGNGHSSPIHIVPVYSLNPHHSAAPSKKTKVLTTAKVEDTLPLLTIKPGNLWLKEIL